MFDFNRLNRVVFHTVDSLQAFTQHPSPSELDSLTQELSSANEALDETLDQAHVSDTARQALQGLKQDLRAEVFRNIERQILHLENSPLLKVQVGTAHTQQHQFSKELKKFEERLQYVLKGLKKTRGEQVSQVEQDPTE